jgi:F-type H+-transporting ATPase subunit b
MRFDCPLSRTLIRTTATALLLCAFVIAIAPARVAASTPQEHAAAQAEAQHDAGAEAEHHEAGWLPLIAKTFNFACLVAILVYFLRQPLATYLASRIARVREDLVTAAATREAATKQLAEIEARLKALPTELAALKRQGEEEIVAERARIEQAAEAEQKRLLEQTRREIDMRLRVARRELVEFTATRAVSIAAERISRSITPADQARLVDRFNAQLEGAPR